MFYDIIVVETGNRYKVSTSSIEGYFFLECEGEKLQFKASEVIEKLTNGSWEIDYKERQLKYYELGTKRTFRNDVVDLIFLTSYQFESKKWQRELERLKSGDYITTFSHLKEISKKEYDKASNLAKPQSYGG